MNARWVSVGCEIGVRGGKKGEEGEWEVVLGLLRLALWPPEMEVSRFLGQVETWWGSTYRRRCLGWTY